MFDVNAKVSSDRLRTLFEYEMYLPVKAVLMFRALAVMVATAELFNGKRKQARVQGGGQARTGYAQSFEKTSIQYRDILRIFVELAETSRDAASRRFDRRSQQQQEDDSGDLDADETASSRASDDGSVYARSIQSRASTAQNSANSPFDGRSVASRQSTPKGGPQGGGGLSAMFGRQSSSSNMQSPSPTAGVAGGFRSSVKTVASLPGSAIKLLGSLAAAAGGGDSSSGGGSSGGVDAAADDYDSKLLGKFDLSAFGDYFGGIEREDRIRHSGKSRLAQLPR